MKKTCWILLLILVAAMTTGLASAQGPLPCRFYGEVSLDGQAVPDGTTIVAAVAGETHSTTTATTVYGPSTYILKITPSSTNPYEQGTPVTFTVNGYQASQSSAWDIGGNIELNLTASTGGATATPAPTPGPTATPPATPAPTPSPTPAPTPTPTPPGVPTSDPIDLTPYIDETGRVQQGLDFVSEDEQAALEIIDGAVLMTEDEEPLDQIQMVAYTGTTPQLPESTHIIGNPYDLRPDGAMFDPAIEITLNYDPNSIPEGVSEEDMAIAYFDATSEEWVELESDVHTGALTVTAEVNHFTVFAILGSEPAPGLNTWVVAGPLLFVGFILVFSLALVRFY